MLHANPEIITNNLHTNREKRMPNDHLNVSILKTCRFNAHEEILEPGYKTTKR